jgi:hypothetical protein
VIQAEAESRRKPAGQGQAPLDPGLLPAEDLPYGGDREAVVLEERPDDVGLVHGADRPGGGIGRQEPRFHRHSRGALDHDGDLPAALRGPGGQALEAVDHLVDAVAGGGDAEGKRREEGAFVAALAAKHAQARLDPPDGDALDEVHRGSSRGRIWKSG